MVPCAVPTGAAQWRLRPDRCRARVEASAVRSLWEISLPNWAAYCPRVEVEKFLQRIAAVAARKPGQPHGRHGPSVSADFDQPRHESPDFLVPFIFRGRINSAKRVQRLPTARDDRKNRQLDLNQNAQPLRGRLTIALEYNMP